VFYEEKVYVFYYTIHMNKEFLYKKYMAKISSTRGRTDKNGSLIEFKLSFDDWCTIWEESGKSPQFPWVMLRKHDIGHYEIGNVYIQHTSHNAMEAHDSDYTQNKYEQAVTELSIRKRYNRRVTRRMLMDGRLTLNID
jgi:hypothetical protein